MNYLNLDEIAPPTKTITIKGKTYEVRPMSVGAFVENVKEAQKIDENSPVEEQLEATIRALLRQTDAPEEVLRALNLDQLTKLSQFVRGELDKEIAEGAEAAKK